MEKHHHVLRHEGTHACDCEFSTRYFLFETGTKDLKPSIEPSEATQLITTQNLLMIDTSLNAGVRISNLSSKVPGKLICKGNKS